MKAAPRGRADRWIATRLERSALRNLRAGEATGSAAEHPSPDEIYDCYYCNNQPAQGQPCAAPSAGTNPSVMYARSRYTGGVNAGPGDGGARFIRDGINRGPRRAMGTRSGGEVVTPD